MPLTFDIEENEFLSDVFQQGEKKGFQKGQQEGQAIMFQHLLERKFGKLSEEVIDKIQSANLATLEIWALRIFDSSSLGEIFN